MSNYISKKILQQVSTEKTTQILLGQPAAQRQRFIQQGEKKKPKQSASSKENF